MATLPLVLVLLNPLLLLSLWPNIVVRVVSLLDRVGSFLDIILLRIIILDQRRPVWPMDSGITVGRQYEILDIWVGILVTV